MRHAAAALWCCAALLWGAGAGRDAVDAWVDATVLPPLVAQSGAEVLDRDGTLLRAYQVADGRWRLAVGLDAVDPRYVAMLLGYEDRRFYDHGGVDPWAVLRAAGQAVLAGHVVSGASTLTMQVARMIEDSGTGTWAGKLRQVRVALALERRLGKDQILTLYLNRAPFGGNLEGVRAASLAYFGKPPRRLTPAEAALLVALPQSPEARRPDRDAGAARAARDRVLARLAGAGVIDRATLHAALREAVPDTRRPFPQLAPHLSDRLVAADPTAGIFRTTLEAGLQARLEALAAQSVAGRSDGVQVAIVVADHRTGEVLAEVGSAAYRADGRAGFVDMSQALRSPGSTLKPLIYGLAFEAGLAHPETLIADRPTDFGGYAPQNFDGLFRGEVRVRTALQLSLNIPAVAVTQALGPQRLIAGLRRAGARPVVPGGKPGLAVALGGVGLTLEDLVRVYAAIADGGVQADLRVTPGPTSGYAPVRVMGDVASWEVADILLQTPRPIGVQGTGIAFKTGTSYGNRDAWAVGFDGALVVGVWMGRADGTPIPGAFGVDLAAPVMFAAFARAEDKVVPIRPPPPATLLLPTAQLPLPLQRFRPPGTSVAQTGPRIAFPPDGAVLEEGPLVVKVADGTAPFTWLANGAPVAVSHVREAQLPDPGPGFSALTVIDAEGAAARVHIEVK
ncbi:MAG: penicillin-binding protein 1C [Limimaricola sp.]|uniref:penicillin-binding protein 1C n=1 Tax=Limimaricola sp. TaxID=2211665 RepID=UPI001D34032C|nr:penicillin-binding protein 1C [Limimaricola sp.]MBI1418857.1 penicillin-binding protein 1C [Limimaricola sp.]